ncbi:MAG: C4-type zinc ribbon domain-containing protein [Bryobacteraceae bacterium]
MHEDMELVSQLQSLDLRIADLEKEIAALPKHIAQIERALESHTRRLEADRAALAANQRDRKNIEGNNQLLQAKISKLREQMSSAKTNEHYKAFQNEIDFIEKEIRTADDRSLELMTASEPLAEAVKKAEGALSEEKKLVEAEKQIAKDRTAADQAQVAALLAERKEQVAKISASTMSTYERIRKKWKGTAVADATAGRCSACQIVLRPQHFQNLRKNDQIMTCENCGRFLYYNPAVTVEGTRVTMS